MLPRTGPVSISPLDWICPLLAIDADAFNHGGTAEFAAISAVAQQIQAARFFEHRHTAFKHIIAQVGHNLDAGQISLVHSAVEALTGEGFLVDGAIVVTEAVLAEGIARLISAIRKAVKRCHDAPAAAASLN